MVASQSYSALIRYLETLPTVSSHEHHLPDGFHMGLTLDRVFKNSYLTSLASLPLDEEMPAPDYLRHIRHTACSYQFPGNTAEERHEFLRRCRTNSCYVWLERGIQRIYRLEGRITPETWDGISARIFGRHSTAGAHLDILRQVGGYRRALQDSYWSYGSDNGHPEIFSPVMRTDMFVTSFHPSVRDHNDNSPFDVYPEVPTNSFDHYLDFVESLFTQWRQNGAVAMKSASAYDRPLDYAEGDRNAAASVFFQPMEKVSPADRQSYENYMFNWFCQLAARMEVPFQVHTGLGRLSGSHPLLLEAVIRRHPNVRFVLLHAGYPWYDDVAGLAHNHSNIWIDMAWAPILSTTGAVLALHELIEVTQSSDRITWGSDAWTSEEAVGALLAWRHVVARVLAEKVSDHYIEMREAEELAEKLMYDNATRLYALGATTPTVPGAE